VGLEKRRNGGKLDLKVTDTELLCLGTSEGWGREMRTKIDEEKERGETGKKKKQKKTL